jgi:predicted dehydrogenase
MDSKQSPGSVNRSLSDTKGSPMTSPMTSSMTSPMSGAIVGLGFISGKGHLPAYLTRSDTKIVAVVDVSAERRAFAKEHLPGVRVYENFDALLSAEKNLDFVDISTPPVFHAPYAIKAMAAGLHVLCEKPLTVSLQEAKDLITAARQYRRVVYPCHNYKHAPVVKAVSDIIHSGEIGTVTSLVMNTFRTTHAKGVREWDTDWRRKKAISGGGIAMDHGSHTFYLTFPWLGAMPTAVTAKMTIRDSQWDTEDNFSCVLTYPTGQATCHLSWTAGTRKVLYVVQGSKGAILVDDDDVQVCSGITQLESTGVTSGTRRFSIASHWGDASHVEWFNSMFDGFRTAIANGDYVNSELKEAYMCIQIIMKSYESAANGCRELPLEPVVGS